MRNLQTYKSITGAELNDFFQMWQSAEKSQADMRSALDQADMIFVFHMCQEIIEKNYDIGMVKGVEEVFGGYMSRSFRIFIEKDGQTKKWFFRRYVRGKDFTELKLEHMLLWWAKDHGNDLVSVPIKNNNGETYVRYDFVNIDGEEIIAYFAVYEYLEGADSYTWVDNDLPQHTSRSVAQAMAKLHNSVLGFDTGNLKRAEPPIFELLPAIPQEFCDIAVDYAKLGLKNHYTEYFGDNLDYYRRITDLIMARVTPQVQGDFPVCPIQGDFHPGNFKYDEHGLVCGIFDFDWASVDHRAFELGLGLVYTFGSWHDDIDGHLYLDMMLDWLREYDSCLREAGRLAPLTDSEKEYMPELLLLGYLYLVRWCCRAVWVDISCNPFEYLSYLRHITRGLKWVESNTETIRKRCLAL